MLKRSFVLRVAAPIAALFVLMIAVLTFSAGIASHRALVAEVTNASQTTGELLSAQMSRAVKWEKADAVERIVAPLLGDGEDGSAVTSGVKLDNVMVTTQEGAPIFEAHNSEAGQTALGAAWTGGLSLLEDSDVIAKEQGGYLVVMTRIRDDKSGDAIGVAGFAWGLSAINAASSGVRTQIAVVGAIGVAAAIAALAFILWSQASRPVTALKRAMQSLAKGDLEVDLPAKTSKDELAAMIDAVAVFRDTAIEARSAEAARIEAEAKAREERAQARERAKQAEEAERQREQDRIAAEAAREKERAAAELVQAEKLKAKEDAQREQAEQERHQMLARLRDAFIAMVDAAAAGDFSKRVDVDFEDPELRELAEGLNNLVKTVSGGLSETRAVLEAIGRYDLSTRNTGTQQGEFAALRDGVNGAADTLTRVLEEMLQGVDALRTQSKALNGGFGELSERTSNQAARIQETSAAVTVLTETVKQNSKRAAEARDRSRQVASRAESGGETMRNATDAMDRIVKSSEEITAIVELIDNIALQTSLLSLNASVEAARAGSAGSGFAVVATEVRNLAMTTATSSNDIRELIQRSQGEVAESVDLVSKANQTLSAIVEAISSVSSLATEISEDTEEQALKLSEINNAVRDFDQATQENAHLVEKSHQVLSATTRCVEDIAEVAGAFALDSQKGPASPSQEAA